MASTDNSYEAVIEFIERIHLNPNFVESIHIDHDWITVVGFTADEHMNFIRDFDTGGRERFVRKFSMEKPGDEND